MIQPTDRLLSGPPLEAGPEGFAAHLARLGDLPSGQRGDVIAQLEASGLLGRGGAGFPVGRKWRAMAERRDGRAIVVANGAEGEPASAKDQVLMAGRPHLVIDGAVLAAEAIGADEIVFYVGSEHETAVAAMGRALAERAPSLHVPARIATAPMGYVAGEASAAVHYLNSGDARPITTPPRVSERGVKGRPTLVQNVESLAYAALIARMGERWYRAVGRYAAPGTALITVSGGATTGGVREIELGTTIGEVAADAGADRGSIRAVALGGYFGTWADAADVWDMPLDPDAMKARGLTFGCGMVGLLAPEVCGVSATSQIMAFLAAESAGQCGPCVHGLRAIGATVKRFAEGVANAGEVGDLERWTSLVVGRGACHHPDGAAQLMTSALNVFGDEFIVHARTGRCSVTNARVVAA